MNDLRKAAEMALGVLLDPKTRADEVAEAVKVIRQALDLETAIERGTKAWADVPDATEWVEELRGNVDKVDILGKRVHKSDKSIHKPVAIVNSGMGGIEWLIEQLPDDTPLYAAPYTKNDTTAGVLHKEWVGLTHDEVNSWELPDTPTVFEFAQFIEAKLKEKKCG